MPKMEIESNSDEPYFGIEISSHMLFPADQKSREEYLCVKLAKFVSELDSDDGLKAITRDRLGTIVRSRSAEDWEKEAQKITLQASIAGRILMFYIQMHISDLETSLNKAKYLTHRFLNTAVTLSGQKSPNNDTSIKKSWSKYKSVAHYWSAFAILEDHGLNNTAHSDMRELVSIGNQLFTKVMGIPPHRNRSSEPLISEDSALLFCDMKLPSVKVSYPKLDKEHLEWLAEYPSYQYGHRS